jgi:hypothetical protein
MPELIESIDKPVKGKKAGKVKFENPEEEKKDDFI